MNNTGLPDPQVRALRVALARKRERVEEWRRCRLDLPISQVEHLIRVIAVDEQRLLDLEASNAQRAESPMQPCAIRDPHGPLEPVLKSLVPAGRPKRKRRGANPPTDHNAIVGAELTGL